MAEVGERVELDRGGARDAPRSRPPAVVRTREARGEAPSLVRSIGSALDERRLFVLLPFAVIVGLVGYTAVGASPEPWSLVLVGAALAGALALSGRSILALRMLALAAAFWAGFSMLAIHGALFGTDMLGRATYGTYQAQVDEVISEDESGRRLVVSAITPLDDARELPVRRARIVAGEGPHIAPGDVIRGPIRFYPVPGPVLPGGFDSQFHAYFDGIGAYANTSGALDVVTTGEPSAPARIVDGVRRSIGRRSMRCWRSRRGALLARSSRATKVR